VTAVTRSVPARNQVGPAAVGLAVWAAGLLLVPAPLAARIFLLAPLVVVPRVVGSLPERAWIARVAGWPLLAAALPLVAAFSVPAGALAGAATVPWLLCALVGLGAAVRHGLAGLPSILSPRRLPDLGVDVALAFWAVGAVFATLDRSGVDTGFSPTVVVLTATHFHFAGFGLLGIGSLVAASRRWVAGSVAGLIVGIPLTALGFVLVSNPISAAGALVVGVSGMAAAVALLTTRVEARRDWLSRVAGAALLVGMPMGIAWSLAILAGLSFLDLDTMVRTHGALNATAVLLAVLALRRDT
jgi:hypothetical protein